MKQRSDYHGLEFEVWTAQGSWFWRFTDPRRERGFIGAAASERDAMGDACAMIDEALESSDPNAANALPVDYDWSVVLERFRDAALEHQLESRRPARS